MSKDERDWRRQYRLAKLRWHWQAVRLDHDDARMLKAIAKRQKDLSNGVDPHLRDVGLEEDDSARRPDDL